ncbi:helix-turn-helix domain-containing protein [Rhodopseudomonas sp. BR0G17]|uniref:helix-turn-helix transcriptional regulator n=1 Tax=Rhodopseudomonas sp. BR0G17 TaxID=2269368 RepID=UPI0013DFFD20|nr:helix-turn-helix domain-containing protein [Rhodopseudomonas sp. BR0G17]NEW97163.1 helix-turn-helix domain-containing protein [Rhodopseudomonas sp. BR0G17]
MAKQVPSIAATQGLRKLGADISVARKRRRMTQQRLADGAGVTVPTIRRLEAGDPGMSLATLAMVLVVLGEGNRLGNLLDTSTDDIGLLIENEKLPQRIRAARRRPAQPSRTEKHDSDQRPAGDDESFGEAF